VLRGEEKKQLIGGLKLLTVGVSMQVFVGPDPDLNYFVNFRYYARFSQLAF
jgi:hypothetical protein